MLKLMYDGREFRLSDGRVVNLADANICVESIDTYQGFFTPQVLHEFEVAVNGKYTGKPMAFTSEFEFELWRNSLNPSGFYTVNNNRIEFLLKGEKVQLKFTDLRVGVPDTIEVTNLGSPVIIRYPVSAPTVDITFTVPLYEENQ